MTQNFFARNGKAIPRGTLILRLTKSFILCSMEDSPLTLKYSPGRVKLGLGPLGIR